MGASQERSPGHGRGHASLPAVRSVNTTGRQAVNNAEASAMVTRGVRNMGEIVAVYGTLRRGGSLHHRLGTAAGRAVAVGTATVAGDIYEVAPPDRDRHVGTSYPSFHPGGASRVVVELYDVVDPHLWHEVDELEGFDPDDLDNCEYHRVRVVLHDTAPTGLGAHEAWTYVYVRGAADPTRRIAGGDWIARAR